jgi:hypothetical protein
VLGSTPIRAAFCERPRLVRWRGPTVPPAVAAAGRQRVVARKAGHRRADINPLRGLHLPRGGRETRLVPATERSRITSRSWEATDSLWVHYRSPPSVNDRSPPPPNDRSPGPGTTDATGTRWRCWPAPGRKTERVAESTSPLPTRQDIFGLGVPIHRFLVLRSAIQIP